MSSNRGSYFSKGQGDSWGNPSGPRRHTQHRRLTQLRGGNANPQAQNLHPSQMVNPGKAFVRGMSLQGCGIGFGNNKFYHQTGKGTLEDPMVAWLYDEQEVDYQSRQAHINIARSVAKANRFQCVLIRKSIHDRECTYNTYGRRNTFLTSNGKIQSVTTKSDNHMTVWMGEHAGRILVGGHIYLVETMDPYTGNIYPSPMTDPGKQRNRALIQPGRGLVSEEFWLAPDTWERC
ncbi:hypothetical protein F5144DRAFT_548890 [Chaetomium tenue]|uniref:Uncharacterized protein n=1 Tax=Chaetomium tenue TaxID=1854479 RepID=A0ACB7P0A3_9PEZI|nr:hypothetical protein F5144DRAFT_548890 [Chaetomium globosum]